MEWVQFSIFFIGVFGLFIWNRTESRSDIRHMDNKIDAIREMTHAIHKETQLSINAIREEVRDFHSKLLEIERSRKQ